MSLVHIVDHSKPRNRNPWRKLDIDLKSLNQWLLANKISLNATKTELIYFRNKRDPIPWKSNIKWCQNSALQSDKMCWNYI